MIKYLTRLQPGDVLEMAGHPNQRFMTIFVNDCRATVVNMENRSVSYKTAFDKEVSFTTSGESFNISPNSLCEIIEHRGEEGLKAWVEGNKKDNPRANKLLGTTVREVALAMGHYNWTFEDAKAGLIAAGHELADVTIRKRLRKGKDHPTKIREEELIALLPNKKKEEDPWAKVKTKPKGEPVVTPIFAKKLRSSKVRRK